jgi:hypothetical protein
MDYRKEFEEKYGIKPYDYSGNPKNSFVIYLLSKLQEQEWISVNDKLPETAEKVLCCHFGGEPFIGFYWNNAWSDLKAGIRDVTHWML